MPTPSLSRTSRATSGVNLRRFYERHPQPSTGTELACLIEGRQAVVGDPERWFHTYFPDQPYRDGLLVLVVGCRNLEAARLAAGAPHTQFVAVDEDDTALDQLDRMARHYRLENLEMVWLAPAQVQLLEREFDLIICPEGLPSALLPEALLRLLRERLKVSGSMLLTVGGRHGSLGISLLRRLLEVGGVEVEGADTETVRQWVEALPASHPFRAAAAEHAGFEHDLGLLDALGTSELSFSVPELELLLSSSGLRLQRFLCQALYMPQCSRLASLPGTRWAARPGAEDELRDLFALTELFRGNLRTHTLIACRDDREESSHAIRFEGREWLGYTPIRNPGLAITTHNLPPDAVARLQWSAHEDPAISLYVTEQQARLFDAADGSRSIGEIVEKAADGIDDPEPFARCFFHSLWCHDYVWFQKPAAPGTVSSGEPCGESQP